MKTGENELQPLLFLKEMFWKTLPGRQRCVSLFCNLLANTSIHRTVRGRFGLWLVFRVRVQERYKRIGFEIAKSTISGVQTLIAMATLPVLMPLIYCPRPFARPTRTMTAQAESL